MNTGIKNKVSTINYLDVTEEWIVNATPNSHKVKDQLFWLNNNIKYKVDDKKVVLDYSKEEKEIAEWLKNTFGGELSMIPRINTPENIKTPDYLFRNERYDLKTTASNNKTALDNVIRKSKQQANNFILDISKSELTNKEIEKQISKIFTSSKRKWINTIIIKRNEKFKVYIRK